MDLFEEFKKAIRPLWGEMPFIPNQIRDERFETENEEEDVCAHQETAWTAL